MNLCCFSSYPWRCRDAVCSECDSFCCCSHETWSHLPKVADTAQGVILVSQLGDRWKNAIISMIMSTWSPVAVD